MAGDFPAAGSVARDCRLSVACGRAARTTRRRAAGSYRALAVLLCIEHIADAAAEGELDDLGLSRKSQVTMLAEVITRLGGRGQAP